MEQFLTDLERLARYAVEHIADPQPGYDGEDDEPRFDTQTVTEVLGRSGLPGENEFYCRALVRELPGYLSTLFDAAAYVRGAASPRPVCELWRLTCAYKDEAEDRVRCDVWSVEYAPSITARGIEQEREVVNAFFTPEQQSKYLEIRVERVRVMRTPLGDNVRVPLAPLGATFAEQGLGEVEP